MNLNKLAKQTWGRVCPNCYCTDEDKLKVIVYELEFANENGRRKVNTGNFTINNYYILKLGWLGYNVYSKALKYRCENCTTVFTAKDFEEFNSSLTDIRVKQKKQKEKAKNIWENVGLIFACLMPIVFIFIVIYFSGG